MTVPYMKIIIGLLILTTVGCGRRESPPGGPEPAEQQTESERDTEMEQSIQLLMDAGSLDRDSAQGTVETLAELGVPPLESAELVSDARGVTLRAVDAEGAVYYLGYGGLGYLEIVRKDSEDGEILYAPEE